MGVQKAKKTKESPKKGFIFETEEDVIRDRPIEIEVDETRTFWCLNVQTFNNAIRRGVCVFSSFAIFCMLMVFLALFPICC